MCEVTGENYVNANWVVSEKALGFLLCWRDVMLIASSVDGVWTWG